MPSESGAWASPGPSRGVTGAQTGAEACCGPRVAGTLERAAERHLWPQPRIGSLCSGYRGLDMAVENVFGGTTAWVADIDPGASAILAHHWPHVPNLGDITAVDWSQQEPVNILTAGFPCQDVSLAGRRAGLAEGTRSGLWRQVARAINELRPELVVIENVRGLLSADAHGNVEPCPWCVGDTSGEPVLRALGAVLGDLAGLGFDAEWQIVRASDIGAPHQRERVFVLAWPAHAAGEGRPWAGIRGRTAERRAVAAHPDHLGVDGWTARTGQAGREIPAGDTPADTDRNDLREQPVGEPWGCGEAVAELARPNAPADACGGGRGSGECDVQPGQPDAEGRPASDAAGDGHAHGQVGHSGVEFLAEFGPGHRAGAGNPAARVDGPVRGAGVLAWGKYEPAIRRWERTLGRPAPAATDHRDRLSPAFVEWLMGLPEGHVTSVHGLSRTAQLKALGNGVVPQQAEAALRILADRVDLGRAA